MGILEFDPRTRSMRPWNAGTQAGPKRPLTQKQIWAIHFHLDRTERGPESVVLDPGEIARPRSVSY